MSYIHDVFISYQRERWGNWVQNHFKQLLDHHLEDALGKEPDIFTDNSIGPGALWQQKIKESLARSKCMVGIWAPTYFESEWCRAECFSIRERMRLLAEKDGVERCLLIPVNVSDGKGFPTYTQSIQQRDFKEYTFKSKGYENTQAYVEFEQRVKDLSVEIGQIVSNAPKFDEAWLTIDGNNCADTTLVKAEAPLLD